MPPCAPLGRLEEPARRRSAGVPRLDVDGVAERTSEWWFAAEDRRAARGHGLVVAIIGTCVAVVGHHKNKPVTNADLLRLIHSASDAFSQTPSSNFTMTTTVTYLKLPFLNAALHSSKDWLAVRSPTPNAVRRHRRRPERGDDEISLSPERDEVVRFDLHRLLGPDANSILRREGFQHLPMTPSDAPLNLTAPPASNVRVLPSLRAFGRLLQSIRSSGCGCSA